MAFADALTIELPPPLPADTATLRPPAAEQRGIVIAPGLGAAAPGNRLTTGGLLAPQYQ